MCEGEKWNIASWLQNLRGFGYNAQEFCKAYLMRAWKFWLTPGITSGGLEGPYVVPGTEHQWVVYKTTAAFSHGIWCGYRGIILFCLSTHFKIPKLRIIHCFLEWQVLRKNRFQVERTVFLQLLNHFAILGPGFNLGDWEYQQVRDFLLHYLPALGNQPGDGLPLSFLFQPVQHSMSAQRVAQKFMSESAKVFLGPVPTPFKPPRNCIKSSWNIHWEMKEALNVLKFTFQKSSMTVKKGHHGWKPGAVLQTDVKSNKTRQWSATKFYTPGCSTLMLCGLFVCFSSVCKKKKRQEIKLPFRPLSVTPNKTAAAFSPCS